MRRRILVPAAAAAVAIVGPTGSAAAASAPTRAPVTIIEAGQQTPVDIAGNALHRGARIRTGTQLRRWLVTMHGASQATVSLICGAGASTLGLGVQERAKFDFALAKGAGYGNRTIAVRVHAAPGVAAAGARASIYLLCATG
jgi:hypothetical protein